LESLALAVVGALIALGGLVTLLPQVRARQLNGGSIGAWVFRAGILILLAGETFALFSRPEGLVHKTMLVMSAAIVIVALAMLLQEWQQPNFILERSFSWGAAGLGVATLLLATAFVNGWFMLLLTLGAFIAVRALRHRAHTQFIDLSALQNIIIGTQATIILLTLIMLVL
jgi:hypothetical protein